MIPPATLNKEENKGGSCLFNDDEHRNLKNSNDRRIVRVFMSPIIHVHGGSTIK